MKKDFCVLPCNGLDKFVGSLTREVALKLLENGDHEMICPVLYHTAEKQYRKALAEKPLLVIDGCNTKCASKLAAEKNLKVSERINVSESARERGFPLIDYLEMDESVEDFVNALADGFETKPDEGEASVFEMPNPIHTGPFPRGNLFSKSLRAIITSMRMTAGLL